MDLDAIKANNGLNKAPHKDGYWHVGCLNDGMRISADKHGEGKFRYLGLPLLAKNPIIFSKQKTSAKNVKILSKKVTKKACQKKVMAKKVGQKK